MALERKLREAKIVVINNNNEAATDKEQQQRINLTIKLNFRLYTIGGWAIFYIYTPYTDILIYLLLLINCLRTLLAPFLL